MERGEVEGASSSWAAVSVAKKDWLRDKKIRIILQTAPERIRELPDAPALPEIGTTAEDKQVYQLYASGSAIGRTVIAPPELPADRLQTLREAFDAMVKDPEFLADIQKLNVELDPLPGEARAGADRAHAQCAASGARARQAGVRKVGGCGSAPPRLSGIGVGIVALKHRSHTRIGIGAGIVAVSAVDIPLRMRRMSPNSATPGLDMDVLCRRSGLGACLLALAEGRRSQRRDHRHADNDDPHDGRLR